MRARVAAAMLLATVAWLAWAIDGGGYVPIPSRSPAAPPPAASTSVSDPAATAPQASVDLKRNIFEYARELDAGLLPRAPTTTPKLPAMTTPTPTPSVRLVGLVGTASGKSVALAIDGQVVVVAPGETALGYRVLAIDQDVGVRISGPDGERVLPLP